MAPLESVMLPLARVRLPIAEPVAAVSTPHPSVPVVLRFSLPKLMAPLESVMLPLARVRVALALLLPKLMPPAHWMVPLVRIRLPALLPEFLLMVSLLVPSPPRVTSNDSWVGSVSESPTVSWYLTTNAASSSFIRLPSMNWAVRLPVVSTPDSLNKRMMGVLLSRPPSSSSP